MSSLQKRVHDYLRDKTPVMAEDITRSSVVEDLTEMLRKAEDTLQVAQARVDKIKRDLANLQQ